MAVACPLDGCEYTAETEGSVIAHATSKTDEVHKGYGGQDIRTLLAAGGGDTSSEGDGGSATSTETKPQTTESTSDGGGGSTLTIEDEGTETEETDTDDYLSPCCEADLYDLRDNSQYEADYACSECGRGFVDE